MNIVVVLNYNDFENTIQYVTKIEKYNCIDKIIVIDNNSNDLSKVEIEKCLSKLDNVDILYNDSNAGYSGGNNIALEYAYNNYSVENFIISNPDIEITEKSFSMILEKMNEVDATAISGIILNQDGSVAKNFAWKLPSYFNIMSETFLTSTILLKKMNMSRFYKTKIQESIKEIEVISGCFFVINAARFKEIGFFDESTFLYYEENILFMKLKKLGYKSYIVNDAPVVHYGGSSTKKNIASFFKNQKIYSESEMIYLSKSLNKNRLELFFYKILYNIGKYEKYLILKVFNRI